MKWLLEGGRLLCPETGLDTTGDLLLEDGTIGAVGQVESPGEVQRMDCRGLVVSPALVDLEAQLCDPGMPWREDLESGSAAAAAGGFTAVLVSPATLPVLDEPTIVRELIERATSQARIKILVAGALTRGLEGQELAEIGLLAEAGAAAISHGGRYLSNTATLRNALLYARPFGTPLLLRAGDPYLDADGSMHEGRISTTIGLRGISDAGEEAGCARLAALSRACDTPLHITGITTARGVEILRRAREEGVAITGSTGSHHLFLTDESVMSSGYDTSHRMQPPLRSESDRQALLAALVDGTLSGAATFHTPWTRAEKEHEFERAEAGAIGLQTAFSEVFTATGDLAVALRTLSAGPAGVLGLERRLEKGAPAEIIVIDPEASYTLEQGDLLSKCQNSPVLGQRLQGLVRATFHDGKPVFEARTS